MSLGPGREMRGEKEQRRCWTFGRSFRLPRDAKNERIDAKSDNGVWALSIPRAEGARRRTVAIE